MLACKPNFGECSNFNSTSIRFEETSTNWPVQFDQVCFWPGLGLPRPKAIVVIPKNQPLPKHLRKKRVKVRSTPATRLQKKDPLK